MSFASWWAGQYRRTGEVPEQFFDMMRAAYEQGVADERKACETAVWLVRQEAEKPDAPDEGVSGWLQEAEGRIRMRSNVEVTGAARLYRAASGGPPGWASRS